MRNTFLALLALLAVASLPTIAPPTKWLNPVLFEGTVLQATYQPSAIKSVQTGTIVIANGTVSNTASITSVTKSASLLTFLGQTGGSGTDPANTLTQLTFTSGSIITANKVGNGGPVTVSFTVTEFLPQFIKSQQLNTIGDNSTVSITSVAVAKSVLSYLGCQTNSSVSGDWTFQPYLALTSSTVVSDVTVNAAGTVCGFEVLEFR